jgi:thioredoxin-dependent peroxiredoxin
MIPQFPQVALAVLTLLASAAAPTRADIPAVGDKAPDFSLQTLEGTAVNLAKLNEGGPVVLVVLRGYPGYQCPICSFQVADLMKNASALKEAGAKVVLVYPGPTENLGDRAAEFLKGKPLPENFYYVTDPGYEFTSAYELRWDAPRETAYPSTFVIDREGVVRLAKVSKTHAGRAKASEALEAVKASNK